MEIYIQTCVCNKSNKYFILKFGGSGSLAKRNNNINTLNIIKEDVHININSKNLVLAE